MMDMTQNRKPPAPPGPPRMLTRRVRCRCWQEPHVRFWWLASLTLIVIATAFCVVQLQSWRRLGRLIQAGVVVEATITEVGGVTTTARRMDKNSSVVLKFNHGGREWIVRGFLEDRQELIVAQEKVSIRIDPADPKQWTYRTRRSALAQELVGAFVLLPAIVGTLAISLFLRVRLLRLWRQGEARAAVVVDSRQTALAPQSRFVRCMPVDGFDRTLTGVIVPGVKVKLERGDILWLISRPGRRHPVIAAAAME